MTGTYTLTILNTPPNSSYALYIEGNDACIGGGVTPGDNYILELPSEYKGELRIVVGISKRTRSYTNIVFPIMVNAQGQDITVDVNDYLSIYSPDEFAKPQEKKKIQEISLPKKPPKPKKTFLRNKLAAQVRAKAIDNRERELNNENESPKPETGFWDRFK